MIVGKHAAGAQPMISGRLLVDAPGDAAWNMAVDQALLESVAAGGQPTLRFYRWQRPTLSLGYFQSLDDRAGHHPSQSLEVVRRTTGGGAIVHDRELTYSVAMPLTDRSRPTMQILYDLLHQAIRRCLAEMQITALRFAESGRPMVAGPPPFLCFQRRTADDLMVAGYKVAGSAQRRIAGAVLQHGSILLHVSRFAPELPGIADLTGRPCATDHLQQLLTEAIPAIRDQRVHRAQWTISELRPQEQQRAAEVSETKFADPGWTQRRSG